MNSGSQDERAYGRHRTAVDLRVMRAGHGSEEFGRVVDLSERGLLLLTAAPLALRSSWDLIVECGKRVNGKSTVHIAGQVRWCQPSVTPGHFDCGIQIKAIDRRDAEILKLLVRDLAFDTAE